MALTFGTAKFGNLQKQEGKPVEVQVSEVLPEVYFNAPQILDGARRQNCFGYFQPLVANPNYENGSWIVTENKPQEISSSTLLLGHHFAEIDDGVYSIKNGVPDRKFSEAKISIKKVEKRWSGKKIKTRLHVEVTYKDRQKIIKVFQEDLKNIFEIIRKNFPSIHITKSDYDEKDEYLSEVTKRDLDTAEVEYHSDVGGWVDAFEGSPKFYIGEDAFYKGMEIEIPLIAYVERKEVFAKGFGFLQIGHENDNIEILWLLPHISLALYWLKKFGVDFRSVIFVKGKTNLFKTTVVALLANLLAKMRRKAVIRLSSTKAFMQEFITKMRDNLACLDDFSNTVGVNNSQSLDNAENAIRAVGDGMFSGKMNVMNFSETKSDDVQSVIVITGEDELGLSVSSLYRLIILPVVEGTFDPTVLKYYAENHEVLRKYFALFIQFLTEFGSSFVAKCAAKFPAYREFYTPILKVPRYIDAAATMTVVVDLIVEFGFYCGVGEVAGMGVYRQRAIAAIKSIMLKNLGNSSQAKPEVRFIYALMQSIGTSKFNGLAANENEYVANSANYIG